MVLYDCSNCGKKFHQNSNYISHKNRKYSCLKEDSNNYDNNNKNNKHGSVDHCDQKNDQTDHFDHLKNATTNHSSGTHPTQSNDQNDQAAKNTSNTILCTYCNKNFSNASNARRHKKNCKSSTFAGNNSSLELEEFKKLFEKLVNSQNFSPGNAVSDSHNTTTTATTTATNTTTANTDSNNTTNNVVNINNYGSEDLSYITETDYENIIGAGFKSVYYLVKYIHFNEKKPENHNIYISNQRSGMADVFEGGKWMKKKTDAFLEELYYEKFTKLEDKFNDLQNGMDPTDKRKFGKFSDQYDDDVVLERTKKEIGLMLYNNRDMPQKTKKIKQIK